ncbi:sterol carrier protein 2-like [Oppia nitens]|uniref:sterol carrier protein 2-like n=1 Tax=Oppia nitens TaxID=1686743 RepID=UPI0023DB7B56|nr:sterol carrier protein 2-like [Oppia nitens]
MSKSMAKGRRVFVVGVGMTRFVRPGANKLLDYPQMVNEAVNSALDDCRLKYSDIEFAAVGYVFGDSTSGQKALYEIGMTGIPIVNVNNNCSTGSSALYLAKNMIAGGLHDCTIAVGFEKMERGALSSKYKDRMNPMQSHVNLHYELYGIEAAPITAQMFGEAGKEHMNRYGTRPEHFAKIAVKNHKHSVNNPNSQFREEHTLQEVLDSPKVYDFLTRYQCCPTSDGSAAAILASEDFVRRNNLMDQAVEILSMQMLTDTPSTFDDKSAIKLIGFDMTRLAAEKAFAESGVTPDDINVVELHDCFSANELITYEALGLCPIGKGKDLVDNNQNTYGGKYVINPSGGLLSKGHPLGATGLAQCTELSWQLRNMAGARQVPGAKLALQHNIGLGGAVVVAIYRLGFAPNNNKAIVSKL